MGPTISLTHNEGDDSLAFLLEAKNIIEGAKVYVGIPEEDTSRVIPYIKKDIPTNAGLLFIHTHGSDIRNIPARPVIEPAIEADKEGLSRYAKAAANAYLDGDIVKANEYMTKMGIRGANDAKRWFKNPNNGWPNNKPETIRKKLTRSLRNRPRLLKKSLANLNLGNIEDLDQTLVDYGEMKRAITFVTDLPATVMTKPQHYKANPVIDDPDDWYEVENQSLEAE